MINLLPPEDKKSIRKEYLGRLAAVWGAFFTFAFFAGAAVLFPNFFIFFSQRGELASQIAAAEEKIKKLDAEKSAGEIKKINERLAMINSPKFDYRLSELFQEIIGLKSAGVKITAINFDVQKTKSSTEARVSLSGKASARDGLLDFISKLKRSYGDQRVSSPITNLISDKDAAFSLTITLPYEKQ